MGKIILVTGENGRAVENYPAKSLGRPESYPAPPFWLDLVSPSENLMWRISKVLKFDREVQRACLSRHREPSCEDFGDYLFVQTSLLEPSRKNLFIQRNIKIILSREYLVTVHKHRTSLHCLLSSLDVSGFAHTGTLLLTLLDSSIDRVTESFCSEEQKDLPFSTDYALHQNPLWWRLRNFKATLLRDANLLVGIAVAGARFFSPDDNRLFESIRTQIHLLSDVTTRLLSRMGHPVEVPFLQVHKKIS
jgi:hypothetical protein